jgi:hypothetical protein
MTDTLNKKAILKRDGWELDQAKFIKDFLDRAGIRTQDVSNTFGDISMMVSLGLVEGLEVVRVSGFNDDVDSASREDITSLATINYMTVADNLNIFSADVNDTILGTGARKVLLTGLDANFDQVIETIELNGTTPVQTLNQYIRINRCIVIEAGTIGYNIGIITIEDVTTNTTRAEIPLDGSGAGLNTLQQLAYTVPNGKTALPVQVFSSITRRQGGSGTKEGVATLATRDLTTGVPFILGSLTALRSDGTTFVNAPLDYPPVLKQKTDIKGVGIGFVNNSRISMAMTLLIVDNTTFGLS